MEGALRDDPGDGASSSPSSAPPPHETARAAVVGDDLAGRALCKQVAELLGRVVSSGLTQRDPRVWEVYARFNDGAGRYSKVRYNTVQSKTILSTIFDTSQGCHV